MFVLYKRTKEEFIAEGLDRTHEDDIVAIKGDANGDGACFYAMGVYVRDFSELGNLDLKYLSLNGGVLTSGELAPLRLESTDSRRHSLLQFSNNGRYLGALGFCNINTPYFRTTEGVERYLLHSGNYSDYALPKTGGTINGALALTGSVYLENRQPIQFADSNGTHYQTIYVSTANTFIVGYGTSMTGKMPTRIFGNTITLMAGGTETPTLTLYPDHNSVFKGNVTAPSFIGNLTGNADSTSRLKYVEVNANQGDLNIILTGGGIAYNYGDINYWINAPSGVKHGSCAQFQARHNRVSLSGQLLWDVNHNSSTDTTRSLWWRATDEKEFTNSKWHQIAFTDSNVASATKLATPRTIWGQSFDGTQDVEGNIKTSEDVIFNTEKYNDVSWSRGLVWRNDAAEYGNLCYINIYGHRYISLTHGAYNSTNGLRIFGNGYITIGGDTASERLHVYGNARIEGDIVATGKIKSTSAHIGAYEEVSMTGNYAAIEPNKFYKWGIVEGLFSVKLDTSKSQAGVTNEYLFQFTAGNGISFNIDSSDYGYIKWGNYMPTQIIMNMTYQVSILDGYASIIEYSAS